MANGDTTGGGTAAAIIKIAGTINPMIGLAASLIGMVRDIRNAATAANPALATELPTDKQIIQDLLDKASLFKGEAEELKAWAEDLKMRTEFPEG